MFKKIILIFISSLVFTSSCFGGTIFWHNVASLNGVWKAQLQMLNGSGAFFARNSSKISTFTITPYSSQEFRFVPQTENLDNAYTLTLKENEGSKTAKFSSKVCVFIVTTAVNKKPDVRISSFNGAKCKWFLTAGYSDNFSASY